ncbi:MAG: tetratricopeptide repeat protein [Candidatus Obscuribacterales bacterium]
MPKLKKKALVLTLVGLIGIAPTAYSQSHNWNMQARAQAENANSRALTLLTKGPVVKGWLDEAIAALLHATAADPTDPVPYTTLGLALDLKQRYGEALDALAKAYQLDPKSKETVLSTGISHYLGHTFDKSEHVLVTLLRQNPKFCDAHIDLGFVYMRLGEFDKAKKSFKQAITCNPNCQPAYQGMAIVDYLSGDLESAYAEATHAETLKSYPPVLLLLAEICALRGDEQQMKDALKKLSKFKQPFEQRPMTLIGFSANHDFHWDPFIADDFDRANFITARALELPLQDKKRASLAAAGKIDQQLARAEQMLASAPHDFYLLRQAGLLNMADGNYAGAVKQFNDVLTKACPNSHIDYLYLGRSLALLGRKDDAAQCVREYKKNLSQQKLSPMFEQIVNNTGGTAGGAPAQTPIQTQPPATTPIDTGF